MVNAIVLDGAKQLLQYISCKKLAYLENPMKTFIYLIFNFLEPFGHVILKSLIMAQQMSCTSFEIAGYKLVNTDESAPSCLETQHTVAYRYRFFGFEIVKSCILFELNGAGYSFLIFFEIFSFLGR